MGSVTHGGWICAQGGGGWHRASVFGCVPLAAPIGLSPLHIPTLCGSERVLVVSTEPPDDLSCLTTPGVGCPGDGAVARAVDQVHPDAPGQGGGGVGTRPWSGGGRPGQRVEEQGTWAAQKHSEAGDGRPVDRGVWTANTVKRPRQQPAHPQYANYWAPRTRKRHQQEHRPQRPTESSDPTQHAKGRTGDCPGPRKGATTRRNVTRGGGGGRRAMLISVRGSARNDNTKQESTPWKRMINPPRL